MYSSSSYYGGGFVDDHKKLLTAFAITVILVGLYFLVAYYAHWPPFDKSTLLDMTSSKLGRTTDYVSDDKPMGGIMMSPAQLSNFYNLTYPPNTTQFTDGHGGVGKCAVSSVNNAPWDLYFKCDPKKPWSKDAIGEALALSSVGSYYLPSSVEDQNLHKVVALAHDPVQPQCKNANAKAVQYTNTNPYLAGLLPPQMYNR